MILLQSSGQYNGQLILREKELALECMRPVCEASGSRAG